MSRRLVFLSYHGKDLSAAERLSQTLRTGHPELDIFLAPWALRPGSFWIPELADAIGGADAFVILIGSVGAGPWQLLEYYEALDRKARRPDFPLVPLLLPGAEARLPFLAQLHQTQIRDPATPESLDEVRMAICGEGREPVAEPWRTRNPYKGLLSFTEGDVDFFFGREQLTHELIDRLRQGHRFLTLVGNSGVGKSSLLQAGIIGTLRRQGWPGDSGAVWPHDLRDTRSWLFISFAPGERPLYALARAFVGQWTVPEDPKRGELAEQWTKTLQSKTSLAQLLDATGDVFRESYHSPPPRRFVIVIDQAEELYTRSLPEQSRRFGELLAEAAGRSDLLILSGLRSDHYGKLQSDPFIFPLTTRCDVEPLWEKDLQRVLTEPARALGVSFEYSRMASDIAAESASAPGGLPLVSYLMEDMWKRLQRRGEAVLRWQDYTELGGANGVLGQRAEAYWNTCTEQAKQTTKRLFILHLVHVPREGEALRRRARRDECSDAEWAAVEELASADWRLLVTGYEGRDATAEVAHEVLLRAWERLAGWVREEREFLEWKGRLEEDRQSWEDTGRDEGALLRGALLAEARRWQGQKAIELNRAEHEYVEASVRLSDREAAEREAQHQRELEANRKLVAQAEARERDKTVAASRLRWITIAATLLAILAFALFGMATRARQTAEAQSTLSHAREILAFAEAQAGVNTECSLALAVHAQDFAHRVPGIDLFPFENGLRHALAQSHVHRTLGRLGDLPTSISWSRTGNMIVVNTSDQSLPVWNALTGEKVLSVPVNGPTRSVAWSQDGGLLAIGLQNGDLKIWDIKANQIVTTLHASAAIWRIAWSPDDQRLATTSTDRTARLWKVSGGEGIPIEGKFTEFSDVSWNPNGRLVATLGGGGIQLSDAQTGRRLKVLPDRQATAFCWGDERWLASGSEYGQVRFWDSDTGEPSTVLTGHNNQVHSVAWRGTMLASASWDGTIKLWNSETRSVVATLTGHTSGIFQLAWSPAGDRLASVSQDGTARIWNLSQARSPLVLHRERGWIWDAVWSPNGEFVASAGDDGTVKIWRSQFNEAPRRLIGHRHQVTRASWSPDGRRLASSSVDLTVRIWDAETGSQLHVLSGHNQPVYDVAWSPDGRQLASASPLDNVGVVLWNALTGQKVTSLRGASTASVAWSPDGKLLAFGDVVTGAVRLWKAESGSAITSDLVGHAKQLAIWDLAWNNEGNLLASASDDDTVRIWEPATGKSVAILTGHTSDVKGIAWSPDGTRIATASLDQTIRLWDVKTGKPTAVLTGHTSGVRSVDWSKDGRLLISAGEDGTLRLFLTQYQAILPLARQQVARGLTPQEHARCLLPVLPQPENPR